MHHVEPQLARRAESVGGRTFVILLRFLLTLLFLLCSLPFFLLIDDVFFNVVGLPGGALAVKSTGDSADFPLGGENNFFFSVTGG